MKESVTISEPPEMKELRHIDDLLTKSYRQRINDVKGSINLALQALELSSQCGDDDRVACAQCYLGLYYMITGAHDDGLEISQKALDHFRSTEDTEMMAIALYNIGSIQYKTADYHGGLENLLQCLKYREDSGNMAEVSRTLKAIGYIYEIFNDSENAFNTYLKCSKISRTIEDKAGESNALNPLSSLYLKKGEMAKALASIDRSLQLKNEIGDTRGLAFAYYGKGKIHLKLKEYEIAQKLFETGLAIHDDTGESLGAAMCELKLGQLHFEKSKYGPAREHCMKALEIAEKMTNDQLIFKAHYRLYKIAKAENKINEALMHHELFHAYEKMVINAETSGKIKGKESMMKVEALEREAEFEKEKREAIERKNAELDTFIYRVSHDLKGPVHSLMGFYKIVEHDITDELSLKYFEMYNKQINRLNDIISELLNISRIKEVKLKSEIIDFERLIHECIDGFSFLNNYDNCYFNIFVNPTIEYYSDKGVLQSIIQNLIENAIKYGRENQRNQVDISISKREDSLYIKVTDTGIGMSEQVMSNVFGMFYRADEESSIPGSGLGMYILKSAVDRLKGKVEVESAENKGTTVYVELPILLPVEDQ